MTFFINPGSEPVDGATFGHASENIQAWCTDYATKHPDALPLHFKRLEGLDSGGRFGFTVTRADGALSEIAMPGLPLQSVRFIGLDEQNVWDFPRLYVDGDSWLWKYSLDVAFIA